MCGILGSVNVEIEDSLLDLISRRGPDDSGVERFSLNGNSVVFGHRRLSILDLSPAGHQPMVSDCGRYVIVFNGEIYNHLELRRKLSGVHFRGHSDTETILYYLAQNGLEAVENFNGIFSFAFFDREKSKLFLCRDPFGIKPLYYCNPKPGKLAFSSEIKPIQQLVHDSVDIVNLSELLHLRYSPSPDTLFKNIRKVRPGHLVSVDLSTADLGITESPFILSAHSGLNSTLSYDDAVEQYGCLLQRAIERQLMSDVEVGILLSGGIDSALVAKFAQAANPRPMKAFTVGFKEQDESDEINDAQDTAMALGLDSIVTKVGFDDFLDIIHSCVRIVEEPLATTSIIPMYYLAKLAAHDVKVVLSGQGADESLGGYGRYQGELYHSFIPSYLARLAGPAAKLFGVRNDQVLRGLQALQYDDDLTRFLSSYTVFQNDKIEKLVGVKDDKSLKRLEYFYDLMKCEKMKSSVQRMMAIDLRMNLADDLLLYTDKITMNFSLECRVPMLDLELVKYIESLPYHYKVKLRQSKIIHRDFSKKVLPESIINRKKKGFQSPTKRWFRKQGPLQEILLSGNSKFSTFFDLKEVGKVLDEHQRGMNRERQIFLMLVLYYWFEDFG
ncbi:MAG: asparagine synthase (glutamine-hydrolyzing) [Deltaproteobacteria bacterium]|nr:MAG: asparagine synthase (glutamine-hydrolyzing) [Deltaproteobacteria bacterium]